MDQLKAQPQQDSKLHFLDYWRIIRIRKTVILAVFVLVVLTATVVTVMLPPYFRSTARIKVERDQSDIAGVANFSGERTMGGSFDPYFVMTEFEVIQSEVVLGPALNTINFFQADGSTNVLFKDRQGNPTSLKNFWSEAQGTPLSDREGMLKLRRTLDVRQTRMTSLIEINVTSKNADEARDIANAVALTYQTYRRNEKKRLSEGGISALSERLAEVDRQVDKQREEVGRLRTNYNIPDSIIQNDAPTPLMTQDTLRRFEQLRIESKTELDRQKRLLEQLKEMASRPDELAQAIPTTGIMDNLLTSYLENLALTEQKLVSLKQEFGPAHSEVLKYAAQVDDLKNKVKQRVTGFLAGLETKVAGLEQSLTSLETEVENARNKDIAEATRTLPYFEAKTKLRELQEFRRLVYQKVEIERTDLKLPKTAMVEIVDTAKAALVPFTPRRALNITLGVIIGLVVGVGLAFFIEYLDTSVKTIDDVERALGSPVLGVIPQNVGILIDEGAESPHAEAYRVLRTNLLFSRKDDKLNTVAVVSAGAGEGKSTTVFNLAAVFAQSGQRVLVVDSDLRRPTLHKMLKVSNSIGLTNYLLKQNSLEEVIQTTSLPTMDFMPSGKLPSSSLGILSSSQMRELITELKQHYDFIFFDSPPVMGVSDASILASEVDLTVQVIQYRRYPQPMNIRAKQLIEKVGGNLAGIVLNNINMSQDESYYYYSGYYHDYYAKNEEEPVPAGGSKAPGKDQHKKA
ncbi:MAG TPA: polysaccharide biosynthesis tyrosine autokinase [Verrucomicrobiae bacterium]